MASTVGNGQPNSAWRSTSPHSLRRIATQLSVVLLCVAGGLWGAMWWQERPLRTVEGLLRQGDLLRATTEVEHFLQDHPHHERALSLKARIFVEQGRSQEAIVLFERVGASEPQDLHAWAKALLQQEQWSLAIPLLEYVDKSGIDHADVVHEIAACYAKLGNFDKALKAAEEFANQPGFAARGELLKGTIHHQRGNLRLTASAWSVVLKSSPDALDLQISPAEFFLEYGRVLLALGEPALAEKLITRSLDIEQSPSAHVSLGETKFQLGKAAEARECFEATLSSDPDSLAARKGLATLALAEGQAERAVELLIPLEQSTALTSEIAFLLQRGYVRLGNEASAKQWQERADQLRVEENIKSAADQILRDTPDSDWAEVIRAYKFARVGNWTEAEILLNTLGVESQTQPFIRDLCAAVKSRGELPSLRDLPIRDR